MMRRFIYTLFMAALSTAFLHAGNPRRICLDGEWEFRKAGDTLWRTAEVPGCVHTDLMSCGLIEDPFHGRNEKGIQWVGEKDWEYRKIFSLEEPLAGDSVWLVMEGVDTYAEVSVNGLPVGECDNMFRTWRWNMDSRLQEGENEITVRFESVFRRDMPEYLDAPYRLQVWPNNDQSDIWLSVYARKAGYNYGWDWGPRLITTGLWKPVYIETRSGCTIETAHIRTEELEGVDISSGKAARAHMRADITVEAQTGTEAEICICENGKQVFCKDILLEAGRNDLACRFTLRKPELWWCNGLGKAAMHEFEIVLTAWKDTASLKQSAGVRTVSVIREDDEYGRSMTVRLNGHDVFCKGANWIPADNFPNRKSRKDYARLVGDAAKANMNMLRVWGGGLYESDAFYDMCDSLGIMVWQDMAFACGMFPSHPEYIASVQMEVKDNVRRLRNHPSLVLWCGNNENEISYYEWGWNRTLNADQRKEYEEGLRRLFHEAIPEAIMEEDGTRYYHPTSPSTGYSGIPYSMGDAHFWSVWKGGWVEEYLKPQNIARFMSEYGFISYPDMHSLRKFIPEWDMRQDSPSMLAHHRAYDDVTRDPEFSNKTIRRYLERYVHVPEDFEDYVHMTQWFQAEAVKVAMEAHRRAKPYCMGTLFWQINDCWPAVSWSSIDYYGRWKALHHYAARAYAPVLASPYMRQDGQVSIMIVSDRKDRFEGILETYLMDFDGNIVESDRHEVSLPADGAADFSEYSAEILDGDRLLYVRLLEEGRVASENTFFSRFPNSYSRTDAQLQFEAEETDGGLALTVRTDKLARGVLLHTDNEHDSFEDNHFDIIPGFARTITVKTDMKAEEFITTLKYKTL